MSSHPDEKDFQKNRLIEKYPFKCTSNSQKILYEYIYPDENIFINEDENISYKFIEEKISWGNSEAQSYQIDSQVMEEQWSERNKPNGNKNNKFLTRYFDYKLSEATNKCEISKRPSIITIESSSAVKISHNANKTIQIQIVRNKKQFDEEEIIQITKNTSNYLDKQNSEKCVISEKKISYGGITISCEQPDKKSSIFQIISNLRGKISKIQKSNKPDKLIFLLDHIPFEKFTISTTKIIKKCKFCESPDHSSLNCIDFKEYSSDFCVHCLGPEHKIVECPKRKCVKCNRTGHLAKFCNADKSIEKCTRCRNVGHVKDDCLIYPEEIDLEKEICVFCNRKGHMICPMKKDLLNIYEYSDAGFINLEDSDDTEIVGEKENLIKIENGSKNPITNEDLNQIEMRRPVCPKCAQYEENHNIENCSINKLKRNKNDSLRNNISKSFFSLAPSKLAKDKNFVEDSFSSDEEDSLRIRVCL